MAKIKIAQGSLAARLLMLAVLPELPLILSVPQLCAGDVVQPIDDKCNVKQLQDPAAFTANQTCPDCFPGALLLFSVSFTCSSSSAFYFPHSLPCFQSPFPHLTSPNAD